METQNNHPARDHVRAKIGEMLSGWITVKVTPEGVDMREEKLSRAAQVNLEKAIFLRTIERCKDIDTTPSWENPTFRHIYKQRWTTMKVLLDNPNCTLKERIVRKDIKSWEAPKMDAAAVWPGGPHHTLKEERAIREKHIAALNAEETDDYVVQSLISIEDFVEEAQEEPDSKTEDFRLADLPDLSEYEN